MTFSVAARCARTGQLGVAVSTAVPAVGAICPFVAPGVGAIATQSWVNPYLGIDGLTLLAQGLSAPEALARLMLGQRPTGRTFALERAHVDLGGVRPLRGQLRRSLGLGAILPEVGEFELELLEHRGALGGLAVLLVLELGDRELHLLDQQRAGADFGDRKSVV